MRDALKAAYDPGEFTRPFRCPCGCKATSPTPHIWVADGERRDFPDALSALAEHSRSTPVRGYVRPRQPWNAARTSVEKRAAANGLRIVKEPTGLMLMDESGETVGQAFDKTLLGYLLDDIEGKKAS